MPLFQVIASRETGEGYIEMLARDQKPLKLIAFAISFLVPTPIYSGAFGDSAVRETPVTNFAVSQQTVICPRLNRDIPASLISEMDCERDRARPQVAGERVRSTRFFGIFGRHVRASGPAASIGDGPNSTPTATSRTSSNDARNNSTPAGKWDRLSELGVTEENFENQNQSFYEQLGEYDRNNGAAGDWSGFDLK